MTQLQKLQARRHVLVHDDKLLAALRTALQCAESYRRLFHMPLSVARAAVDVLSP